ncbi:unnamed protein product [Effrenium voratum]|nr:unnamed protein product [Effrenium voratum]
MKGTSDFEGCEALVKRIFDKNAPCLIEQCSFYGVYQPRVLDVKFLAFSHFADIAGDLGVPEKGRLEDLLVAARYVCSLSRAQLDLLFKRVQDETIRMHLCFHATFAVTLLHSGYGIEENDILFKSNHNGQPIDWAVGAMMYAINQDNKLSRPLVNVSTAHVLDV